MSLVHEALQKAEREKQRKTGVAPAPPHKISPPPAPQFSPTESRSIETPATVSVAGTFAAGQPAAAAVVDGPAKKQSSFLTVLIVSVAVVAIVAIVFLASLATSAIRDSRRVVGDGNTAALPAAPASPAAAPQPASAAAVPAPVTADSGAPQTQQPAVPSPDPRYKISGITKDTDGKYWAIINGQLRSEDQYVDGATVKSVERDRATLTLDNGQTIVLRLF
jgi:hypothetical protein